MARKTAEAPAPKMTTRELLEGFAYDETRPFYLGISSEAPFDAWTIYATSFERRRGIYDPEDRSWTVEPGRVVDLSPQHVEKIREKAKRIFLNVVVAEDPRVPGRKKIKRIFEPRRRSVVDLDKQPKFENEIRRRPTVKRSDGQITEWRCLADFLILEERAGGSLTQYDSLTAELSATNEENRRLREELARANQE